jgi:hypothetical protein
MTDAETAALITAVASLIVALISGGFSLRNRSKTDSNSAEIERLKGAVERDLERLKAKLSHGQLISSTQWNAEFSAYQAIWKGMVAVRILAVKIVRREGELADLGLHADYLASPERLKILKSLIEKFVRAAKDLLSAIQDNAPFYPAPIREAANGTQGAAKELFDKQLKAITHVLKGNDAEHEKLRTECEPILRTILEGVDLVESLIRERLAAVEVVNSMKV